MLTPLTGSSKMLIASLDRRLRKPYTPPVPLPYTRRYWLALGLVTGAFLLFCGYFILYMSMHHFTFTTSAEDLGIMDQAFWNTTHGNFLHQTICNIISDVNCLGPEGTSRLAIHVEPILLLLVPIYAIHPGPITLFVIQTVVVGLGAFPAFWLARLRLRSEAAAVIIAMVYLLYPSLHQAITFDFHAVTLTSSLLLFTFYFLYTRRNIPLFIFAILSIGCKEEISLVIFMMGLWTIVFQRRLKVGFILLGMGAIWFVLAMKVIMPLSSSRGKPVLIGRYDSLGGSPEEIVKNVLFHPISIIRDHVLEPAHRKYLRILLVPACGLPLLAPWVLIIALPSLLINLLSSSPNMYSGTYQYNAEIIPILIIASIEGLLVFNWCARKLIARVSADRFHLTRIFNGDDKQSILTRQPHWGNLVLLGFTLLLPCLMLISTLRYDRNFHGQIPHTRGFQWPTLTAHHALAEQIIQTIPADAIVSAQNTLVPHLSQRPLIYLFPYQYENSDYVFLDLTSNTYPILAYDEYLTTVKQVLENPNLGIVAAQDGFLLLKRGQSSPEKFSSCGYTQSSMGLQLFDLLNEVYHCSPPPGTIPGNQMSNKSGSVEAAYSPLFTASTTARGREHTGPQRTGGRDDVLLPSPTDSLIRT